MRTVACRCGGHVVDGVCDRCGPRKQDGHRVGSANERGYDYQWQKESYRFRQTHPLCAMCERVGRLRPATLVDHIRPHRGDMDLFWDEGNWQSLCAACHAEKTARGE